MPSTPAVPQLIQLVCSVIAVGGLLRFPRSYAATYSVAPNGHDGNPAHRPAHF
jgi:hypothetical protein